MHFFATATLLTCGLFQVVERTLTDEGVGISLVEGGHPDATIGVAAESTPTTNLAALELQCRIHQMTEACLPIAETTLGSMATVVLVGKSQATRKLGLHGAGFESQEYLIQLLPKTLALIGRDWKETSENRSEIGHTTYGGSLDSSRHRINYHWATESNGESDETIELPGLFDDQGTCYATYHLMVRTDGT